MQVVFRPGLTVYIYYVEYTMYIFSRGLNGFCQTRGVYTFPQRTKQSETQSKEHSNANVKIGPIINISLRLTYKAPLTNSGCNWSCVCN